MYKVSTTKLRFDSEWWRWYLSMFSQPGHMLISLPESCLLTTSTVLNSYLGPFIKRYSPKNHFKYLVMLFKKIYNSLHKHTGTMALESNAPFPPVLAGNPTSPLYWHSVCSWCVNATEVKRLIGSLTLTRCQNLTPAPHTSQTKSWLYCPPVCRERLGSNARQCGKSTHLIKPFLGVCVCVYHI